CFRGRWLVRQARASARRLGRIRQPSMLRAKRLCRRSRRGCTLSAFVRNLRPCWLPRGNELMLTQADQVGPSHAPERLAQDRPVVGVVIAQEGLVQPAHSRTLGDNNVLAVSRDLAQWIALGVIHRGGGGHWTGQEGLNLVGAEAVALEPER